MTIQLSRPTFLSGPRDDLATADIYTRRSGAVINSIQDLTRMSDPELQSVLRGGSFLAKQLPVFQGLVKGNLLLNKDNLIARLSVSSGSVVSGIRNMSASLTANIGSAIPGGAAVYATIGGISQQVSASALIDLSAVGRTISEVVGDKSLFSVTDMGATIGMYTGLVDEASRCGIPNSLGGLLTGQTDPYVVNRVVAATTPMLVQRGDIASLNAAANLVSPGSMRMHYPNMAQDFSRSYVAPRGYGADQYRNTYGQVVDTYGRADAGWNRSSRVQPDGSSSAVLSLRAFQGSSRSMRKVLDIGVQLSIIPEEKYYALANHYPATTVDQQLRSTYPRTVVGAGQRTNRRVVDPRTLTYPTAEQGYVVN